MANPYHKGHPIVYLLTFLALGYGVWAGGVAWGDIGKCRVGGKEYAKSWHWMPPEWECKGIIGRQP